MTDLNSLVERHWTLNESLCDDQLSSSFQEDAALTCLKDGYTVCKGGRVQLPCLWKDDQTFIPSNFDYARKRLRSLLQSKLLRDSSVKNAYDGVFKQWEKESIIHRIVVANPRTDGYYWAHFPVCRPDRETTKVRPVFDGAAKHGGCLLYTSPSPRDRG